MTTTDISRHRIEMERNLDVWNSKPLLREIYNDFYQLILSYINKEISGRIVELGSGIGNLKSVIPEAIITDVDSKPWIDQIENAYSLSFPDQSVSNLILFDVFHHLEYPGSAIKEFYRVLEPAGRLIIFDLSVSLLGFLVYGIFHHEPIAFRKPINWEPDMGNSEAVARYYAAQGNASRIFFGREYAEKIKQWKYFATKRYSAISYIFSLGYRKHQLYPTFCYPWMKKLDKALDLFPSIFSTRVIVVLEKPRII
jgi:SAM-dependent methyltransferase